MASASVSISSGFPKGLRVLLVDEEHSRGFVESQLRAPDLNYCVTTCGSATEALSHCRSGVCQFDVVLAEARLVAVDEATGRAFIDAFEETPVVLMSEGSTTGDVLRAVKLGAVDWLDKPLSVLKLKNIWQHSVRRMMQRTSLYDGGAGKPASAAPGASQLLSKRSSGLDSPATPTLGDAAELDSISAASLGSIRDLTDFSFGSSGGAGAGSGMVDVVRCSLDSCDGSEAYHSAPSAGQHQQQRPPLAVKPSSFGPLVPVPPPSQWPQLQPGCVWGTPVGGPLAPPPLPAPPAAPAPPSCPLSFAPRMTSASQLSLSSLSDEDTQITLPSAIPAAATCDSISIPEGFFEGSEARSERGPIGLKLKKSGSLLNLINAALSTC